MHFFKTIAAAGVLATAATAQLQPGDIAFTGFNADGNDDLAFVTFKDIPAGDTLRFCDSEWNGTGFGTDEGDFAWVATSLVPAGTVVAINNLDGGTISASVGEIPEALDESGGMSTGGEAMFVFQGSGPRDVSVMLAAVSNNTADAFGVLTGTGLVEGTSAIVLPSSADIAVYDGPRSGLDQSGYLAALNDMDNWLWEDTGDDDHDNATPPDLPFDTTAFTFGSAPPALGPGDIAFTGFNADGNDDLAFVALKDIPANTRIYFCDSEWNGSGFGTDEGDYSWSHASAVPAGTVVTLSGVGNGPVPSVGTIVHDNAGGIGNSDEAVFAYLTAHPDSLRTPSTFLAAVSNGAPSAFGTLEGTGLTQGVTAIALPEGADVAAYAGPRTGLTAAAYRAALNDPAVWVSQDGGGDQSNDAVAPDLPFDATAFAFGAGSYTPVSVVMPEFAFESEHAAAREDAGSLQVRIVASGAPSDTARIGIRVAAGTAVAGTDYAFADHVLVWPADSAGPMTVSIPLTNDAVAQPDRFFALELHDPVNGTLGDHPLFSGYILDDENHAPAGSDELGLTFVSSFLVDSTEGASAEIVAHDPVSQRLFAMNSTRDRLEILDFRNPSAIRSIKTVDLLAYGTGGTSVAVRDGLVAVTLDTAGFMPGKVVFLDTNGTVLKSVTVGSLPDMVIFSPDGRYVLTANEGQPSDDYATDPEGSVSIIDMRGGIDSVAQARVHTAGFTAYNAQKAALQAAGIRIFGPGATVAQDLEPEYIAVSEDSKTAWVTLQENNAVARIDLATKEVTDLFPLGTKDHSLPRNALDASDRSDSVMMMNWPIRGVYMPDAVAALTVGDTTFLFTANEGDAREYGALEEEVRIGSSGYLLDTVAFPDHRLLKQDWNLGRLSATTASGDTDGDGYFEEIHVFGGRSFSVWNGATGAQVWDSGDDMERIIAEDATYGALFNAGNDNNNRKNRSDNKGPEPEGIVIGAVGAKRYAFIALERIGGVMAYDVTDPRAPRFVAWANNRSTGSVGGDLGSEGILFIPKDRSPNDTAMVVLANEVSATVSVYAVRDTTGPAGVRPASGGAAAQAALTLHRPAGRDIVYFSRPVDYRLVDVRGVPHRAGREAAWMDLRGLESGRYFLAVPGEKTHVLPVIR